jgi:hypothetical protein
MDWHTPGKKSRFVPAVETGGTHHYWRDAITTFPRKLENRAGLDFHFFWGNNLSRPGRRVSKEMKRIALCVVTSETSPTMCVSVPSGDGR